MVQIEPGVEANYAVLFNISAEPARINDFIENILSTPDPRGGHSFRPGLQSLTAVSVEEHAGYSLQWDGTAAATDITNLKNRIKASPIVWQTFENIAPSNIKLEPRAAQPAVEAGR